CDGDGEIDEEDHAPVGELGEKATGEDTDCGASAADCTPGGERLRLRVTVEAGRDDRQRRGGKQRGAEALTRTCREQRSRTSGQRRGEGGSREDPEACEEQA